MHIPIRIRLVHSVNLSSTVKPRLSRVMNNDREKSHGLMKTRVNRDFLFNELYTSVQCNT